ncbi:MAG: M20/M25/M40 family metallo-hydrolase [Acidobacteria bacterium]|nr:M20/M25/M40 family metallo-hydrolase [Acidobacteriota bacterium]
MTSRVRVVLLSLGVAALLIQAPLGGQAAAASAVDAAARHVDRAQLMRDVETLAATTFEGRRTGTPGGLKARQWLVDEFRAIGLQPAGTQGYSQPFTFTTRDARAVLPGGRPFRADYAAANVIGRVPGREIRARLLVITAHYDHLGIRDGVLFPGADDNASGVAVLLAAARHFARNPPRHPIVLAALDAEELGLRGARALIDSALLPRSAVAMNINLDMLSHNDRHEIFAAGTSHTPWLRPLLQEVQTRASVNILFGHDRPIYRGGGLEDWTQSSDHGPFHDAGIPFVYFGVEDHPAYHTSTDTADRIDPRFFGDVADMTVEAVRTFDLRVE